MAATTDKMQNIQKALKFINQTTVEGHTLVVLPECFNSPYGTKYFSQYAEEIPDGETSKALSKVAKEKGIFIVGGSIPEKEGPKYFNTSTVWNPEGKLVGKYRKLHLFDIDIPGEVQFFESKVLSKGNSTTTFNIGDWKIGLGICYDLRFNELSNIYRKAGVDILLYPGAFNMKTGPLHWELLLKARAVDNQVFVAGVSTAQDRKADYVSWGHSMLVDPWGFILAEAEFDEKTLTMDLDLRICKSIREQIPTMKQRRTDMFDTISKI